MGNDILSLADKDIGYGSWTILIWLRVGRNGTVIGSPSKACYLLKFLVTLIFLRKTALLVSRVEQ
jgi:hypothetical protein